MEVERSKSLHLSLWTDSNKLSAFRVYQYSTRPTASSPGFVIRKPWKRVLDPQFWYRLSCLKNTNICAKKGKSPCSQNYWTIFQWLNRQTVDRRPDKAIPATLDTESLPPLIVPQEYIIYDTGIQVAILKNMGAEKYQMNESNRKLNIYY